MRALVLAHGSIIDRLWSRVAFGIILQQGVQTRDGFRECFPLKMGLPNAQQYHWKQLLRCQETRGSVVFSAVVVQDDEGRRPLHIKIVCLRLSVERQTHGDHMTLDELDDIDVWIRNRIHLLTTNSIRIVEVKEHRFVFSLSPSNGCA